MWAHAEYVKLLRSTVDGEVFDRIPEVAERYQKRSRRKRLEIWKPNRQVRSVRSGWILRVQAPRPFILHWTDNDWQDARDARSVETGLAIEYVDVPIAKQQRGSIRFTFRWLDEDRWEGGDYEVRIESP